MKSASQDNKPFFLEVETNVDKSHLQQNEDTERPSQRGGCPLPLSTVTHHYTYLHLLHVVFFVFIFQFVVRSMISNVQKRPPVPQAQCVLIGPELDAMVMVRKKRRKRRRRRRSRNQISLLRGQRWRTRGMKVKVVPPQWYHVSGSWLMSVKLVSLRMTLTRSKDSACRIRSICT